MNIKRHVDRTTRLNYLMEEIISSAMKPSGWNYQRKKGLNPAILTYNPVDIGSGKNTWCWRDIVT